jgi:hypothetical protein
MAMCKMIKGNEEINEEKMDIIRKELANEVKVTIHEYVEERGTNRPKTSARMGEMSVTNMIMVVIVITMKMIAGGGALEIEDDFKFCLTEATNRIVLNTGSFYNTRSHEVKE